MELSFAQKGEHDTTEIQSTSNYSNLRTRFAKKLFFAKNAFARSVQSYPRQFRATSNLSHTFRPLILQKKMFLVQKVVFRKESFAFRKMVFMTQHNATQKASLSTLFAPKTDFSQKVFFRKNRFPRISHRSPFDYRSHTGRQPSRNLV